MTWSPALTRGSGPDGMMRFTLGHPMVDAYLAFVAARARPDTALATAFDLKVFFTLVPRDPAAVTTSDVFAFIEAQRAARASSRVIRLEDGASGLATRTIRRRLSSVSGLFRYLVARGDAGITADPVPRGLAVRRIRDRPAGRSLSLLRVPRTLPRILPPEQVDALLAALRTRRDRAMVEAMLLGGLRRCEVLGLRLADLDPGRRRVFVAEGKGGHQRVVPVSGRFFATLAGYLAAERPETPTEAVFVVLKGAHRGRPLSAAGLDQILRGARDRAGLGHATCHQLRHTCLTRLREAGMALEAVQAQAGHRSIESTRMYLHLTDAWLATEYARAVEALEADAMGVPL